MFVQLSDCQGEEKLRQGGEVQNIFHIIFILVEPFHSLIRILISLMDHCYN